MIGKRDMTNSLRTALSLAVTACTFSSAAVAGDLTLLTEVWSEVNGEPVPSLWREEGGCSVIAEAESPSPGTVLFTFVRRSCPNEEGGNTESATEYRFTVAPNEIQHAAGSAVNIVKATRVISR